MQQVFKAIISQALEQVSGEHAVSTYLTAQQAAAKIPVTAPLTLLAIGKAAVSMASGAAKSLKHKPTRSLVITKYKHNDGSLNRLLPQVKILESAHPVPDENSLKAGNELLELCDWLKGQTRTTKLAGQAQWLLCLISGGASALVEHLKPGISLAELQAVNQELLSGGQDIRTMNLRRQEMSLLKRGGLARLLPPELPVTALYLSDVAGNDPAIIGSGLLAPAQQIRHKILLDNQKLVRLLAQLAQQQGYEAVCWQELVTAEVSEAATMMMQCLRQQPGKIHIWGGEPTVKLPPQPGRGGRNQHLVLLMARHLLAEPGAYGCFASLGSDGTDGFSENAGGIIDSKSATKLKNLEQEIQHANSDPALTRIGAQLKTGATGSNLMDLMLGFRAK